MRLTADQPLAASNFGGEEEQAFLQSLAAELIEMLEATEKAMSAKYNGQNFDIEEALALWELLPAKVRTAIKRGK